MERQNNIVECYEYIYVGSFPRPKLAMHYAGIAGSIAMRTNSRPKTIRILGANRVMDRIVTRWSNALGSYGMGGPGFFGLTLAETSRIPEEKLVLTLWAASEWLLLDGVWFSALPNQYHVQEPLYSAFEDQRWDRVTDKLVGARITDANFDSNRSQIYLQKGTEAHVLEIPGTTNRLPKRGGSLQSRIWYKHENQSDAWVVTKGDLFC